jgi:hypothetical protein
MTAERLSIRELDSICTEFEKSWQPDRELARLIEFAARRVPRDSVSFKELVLDLSLIDMEKRWGYRSDRLNLACRRGVRKDRIDLSTPPDYQSYLQLLAPNDASPEDRLTLAQAELNARWTFGDVPEIEEFLTAVPGVKRPEVPPPSVQLVMSGQIVFETDLIGTMHIGRQARGEPPPFTVAFAATKKLICSELMDASTSRKQLELRPIARHLVLLYNGSENRSLVYGDGRDLEPKESRIISFAQPLQIPLKHLAIVIGRS